MKIRPARAADAPTLAALLSHLGYPNNAANELPARLATLERNGDAVLVAESDDGAVVGMAALHLMTVFHFSRPLGYITAFVTDPTVRRQGIGKKLLAAAEEWARSHNCYRLALTSAEHRKDAHAFYPASGFPQTGRRFGKEL